MAVVGWIILSILLFLLVLILLVFFFPITYSVKGSKTADELMVKVRVKWLFGFLSVLFDYPKPAVPRIKILFFELKQKTKKEPQINTSEASNQANAEKEEPKAETLPEDEAESKPENDPTKDKKKKKDSSSKKNNKNFSFQKLKDEYHFYRKLWDHETTKSLLKDVFKRVGHILKNLFPRKVTGKLIFGGASPDLTGYIYGVYCVISGLFTKRFFLQLTPDFENEILEGQFLIKGHITIFLVVWDALRILLDRRLKKIIKVLKAHNNKS